MLVEPEINRLWELKRGVSLLERAQGRLQTSLERHGKTTGTQVFEDTLVGVVVV